MAKKYKEIKNDWQQYILQLFGKAKKRNWSKEELASMIAGQIADAQRHADNDGWEEPMDPKLL